jgi:hypothetical protein
VRPASEQRVPRAAALRCDCSVWGFAAAAASVHAHEFACCLGAALRRHPKTVVAHIGFKTMAVLAYIFSSFYTSSYIIVFITVITWLSLDFWFAAHPACREISLIRSFPCALRSSHNRGCPLVTWVRTGGHRLQDGQERVRSTSRWSPLVEQGGQLFLSTVTFSSSLDTNAKCMLLSSRVRTCNDGLVMHFRLLPQFTRLCPRCMPHRSHKMAQQSGSLRRKRCAPLRYFSLLACLRIEVCLDSLCNAHLAGQGTPPQRVEGLLVVAVFQHFFLGVARVPGVA